MYSSGIRNVALVVLLAFSINTAALYAGDKEYVPQGDGSKTAEQTGFGKCWKYIGLVAGGLTAVGTLGWAGYEWILKPEQIKQRQVKEAAEAKAAKHLEDEAKAKKELAELNLKLALDGKRPLDTTQEEKRPASKDPSDPGVPTVEPKREVPPKRVEEPPKRVEEPPKRVEDPPKRPEPPPVPVEKKPTFADKRADVQSETIKLFTGWKDGTTKKAKGVAAVESDMHWNAFLQTTYGATATSEIKDSPAKVAEKYKAYLTGKGIQ